MRANVIWAGILGAVVLSWCVPSAAEIVSRTSFREEAFMVSIFETTPITCADGSSSTLETSVFINGYARVLYSSGRPTPTGPVVSGFFSRLDRCTGEILEADELAVDPDYRQTRTDSATLNASFALTDRPTGTFIGHMDVALVFSGVGKATRSNSHSVTRSGDRIFLVRANGTFREAQLSGSISVNGDELIDDVQFAQLSTVRSGDLVVEH